VNEAVEERMEDKRPAKARERPNLSIKSGIRAARNEP
jgi:hypothetical protein